jgi:hypothetical protein
MGEKFSRAVDYCIQHRLPFLVISKSGGARMMESALSLMQLAKTSGKLSQLIKDESFTGDNFMTPRSIDKAVNMIINDVPTPYSDTIKPILSELIKNPFEEQVQLDEERLLEPSEMISWLDLIKIKNKQK